MEFWKLEARHLTVFPVKDGTEKRYIITKKGEIKTFVDFLSAHEALLEEYPIEDEE